MTSSLWKSCVIGFIQICPDLLMIYPPILILETPMFTMFTMFKMPISSMDPPIFLAPPSRSCWCSGLPIPKDPDLQNSFVGWIMLDPKFNPGWWCHPIKKNGMSSNWLWQTAPNNWLLILNCCLNQRMGLKNLRETMVLPSFLRFSCHPVQFLQEF